MKLASIDSGRDGQLLIVSRDLNRATPAKPIAATMQSALDHWQEVEQPLCELAMRLEQSQIESFAFDEAQCAAPLPRAFQWIDGSAYVNHVKLLRRSRGKTLPDSFWEEPLMYQGGSDDFTAARGELQIPDERWGIDFEAEIAVITDDVPMGIAKTDATQHIKLYLLVNDLSLRRLIPDELAKGFGFFQGKPTTSFSPVAVTPDELQGCLREHTLALPLLVHLNGKPFGCARPDVDQVFTFPDLIAHAAKTRNLVAGSIIGGGTVSNKLDDGPGSPIDMGGVGYSCIAEQRAVETILDGKAGTEFLRHGDRVRIEVRKKDGSSIFGAIDQTVRTD